MAADDRDDLKRMRETAKTIGLTDLLLAALKSKQGSQIKELLRQALIILGSAEVDKR